MLEINSNQFETEVLSSKNVVVNFYSTECPPCESLAPKFQNLSMLYSGDVKFVKVFRQGNRELAESLGVKSSPTLLFFQNGKQIGDVLSGGIKRSEIVQNLELLISEQRAKEIKETVFEKHTSVTAVVLGAGPAGLAAATYLSQAKIETLVVDQAMPGGQVSVSHMISNYPGFVEPVSGNMLSHYIAEQASVNGAKSRYAVDVTNIDLKEKTLLIDGYETVKAKYFIIANGVSPRLLGAEGEKELMGKGISYCTTCDAKYYDGKEVVVVGGGNSAVEEAGFIAKFASKITIIQNLNTLTANQRSVDILLKSPKVSVVYNANVKSFVKTDGRLKVIFSTSESKKTNEIITDGVFVFVGMVPNTQFTNELPVMSEWGYIKTNEDMQTSIGGVYAIGDIIDKKYRQITTAVADGTIAAMHITMLES